MPKPPRGEDPWAQFIAKDLDRLVITPQLNYRLSKRKMVFLRFSAGPAIAVFALLVIVTTGATAFAHRTAATVEGTNQRHTSITVPLAQSGITVHWMTSVSIPDGHFLLFQGPDVGNLSTIWEVAAESGVHSHTFRDPRVVLALGVYRLVYQDRHGTRWVLAEVTVHPKGSLESDGTVTTGPDNFVRATLTDAVGEFNHAVRLAAAAHRPVPAGDGCAPPKPPP